MAEIVSTAVLQETVSQVISNLVQKYEEKEDSTVNRKLERLEVAQIKLEAALKTSDKWQVTDASLLRWRRKLKGVAQECDDTLHKWKKRILEDEQMEYEVHNSSLPNRIAHAAKSFVSSIFNRDDNGLGRPTVQRFEWYADGASEFLRFMELGGTPHRHMPFDSISKKLLAGKELHHKIILRNGNPSLLLWVFPYRASEHGTEACLLVIRKDGNAPEGNIYFGMTLQLSESTDIFAIAIKSLQLLATHAKCAVEHITNELTQLPTQLFSWLPPVYSYQKEHWHTVHSHGTQWFRPNPLCCKQNGQRGVQHFSNLQVAGLSDVSIEPLVGLNLQWQVSLPVTSKQKTSLQDYAYLKAGVAFAPHDTSEGMLPENNSSVAVAIVGGEQHLLHSDIALEQLGEIMLPKAIDYFSHNAEATMYQMIWKSKHGVARIQVEKPSTDTRQTSQGARKRKLLKGQDPEFISETQMISHLVDIWVTHAPLRLQRLYTTWMKKQKEIQSGSPQLHLKYESM